MKNRWITQSLATVSAALISQFTLDAQARDLTLVLNPYSAVNWETTTDHKANFHTHTTRSDGRLSPQEVIDEYRSRGYTILSITDHNMATYPWTEFSSFEPSDFSRNRLEHYVEVYEDRDPESIGMTAIPGNELSDHHHTVSLFSDFETDSRDIRQSLKEMENYSPDALAFLAHPFHSWSLKSGSLRIPVTPALNRIFEGEFTMELWFRTDDPRRGILIANTASDTAAHGTFNIEFLSDNQIRWTISGDEQTESLVAHLSDFNLKFSDGQWHHLLATRTSNELQLIIDGIKMAEAQTSMGKVTIDSEYIYIGRDARVNTHFYDTISVFRHPTVFRGDMDHLRFWNRSLTDSELQSILSGKSLSREKLLLEYNFETVENIYRMEGSMINKAIFHDTAGTAEYPPAMQATLFSIISDPPPALSETGMSRQAIRLGDDQPLGWRHLPETVTRKYRALFEAQNKLIAIEVRGTAGRRSSLDVELWDFLLSEFMPNRPLWGIANDDMHGWDQLGFNWSIFPLQQANVHNVRNALLEGAYYFVSTERSQTGSSDTNVHIVVENIRHDEENGILTVVANENNAPLTENAYRWIANGITVHTGSSLNYRSASGIENYVRLEVRGTNATLYLNPFGFSGK